MRPACGRSPTRWPRRRHRSPGQPAPRTRPSSASDPLVPVVDVTRRPTGANRVRANAAMDGRLPRQRLLAAARSRAGYAGRRELMSAGPWMARSESWRQEPAAADVDDLAGDVARLLRHQEGHDGGDLVGAAVAAQRRRFDLAPEAAAVGLREGRLDQTRSDGVAPDA